MFISHSNLTVICMQQKPKPKYVVVHKIAKKLRTEAVGKCQGYASESTIYCISCL